MEQHLQAREHAVRNREVPLGKQELALAAKDLQLQAHEEKIARVWGLVKWEQYLFSRAEELRAHEEAFMESTSSQALERERLEKRESDVTTDKASPKARLDTEELWSSQLWGRQ